MSFAKQPLAATQTLGEDGKKWYQGTTDVVRQFTWIFQVSTHYLRLLQGRLIMGCPFNCQWVGLPSLYFPTYLVGLCQEQTYRALLDFVW